MYDGIDLRYDGAGAHLKGTYLLAPKADPTQIRWRYKDVESVEIDKDSGDLMIIPKQTGPVKTIDFPPIREQAPLAWQEIEGKRLPVDVRYTLDKDKRIGFELGHYDSTRPLVIDPTLDYSTYLGGSSYDYGYDVAVDAAGNAYIGGFTYSSSFPGQTNQPAGSYDVFVTKMAWDGVGFTVGYTTFWGGPSLDIGNGIAVEATGNATVAGYTYAGGYDGFAARFDPTGALAGNILLTGSSSDLPEDIAVDAAGDAYIAGYTYSSDFLSGQMLNSHQGGYDAFLVKLDWGTGNPSVAYGTFFGGSSSDYGMGVAVDDTGHPYLSGYTYSSMAFTHTLGTQLGGSDTYVVKYEPDGTGPVYSTRIGGSSTDQGQALAVDDAGHAYVAGSTYSANFPADDVHQGSYDVFVLKLTPSGDATVFSRLLGGSNTEYGTDIALSASGNVYVTGYGYYGGLIPTNNALQPANAGGADAIVVQLGGNNGEVQYSSYLGGSSSDYGRGIAVHGPGHIYLTGDTYSSNFPTTPNRAQGDQYSRDVFFTRIGADASAPTPAYTKYYYAGGQLIAFQRSSGYGQDAGYGLRYVFRDHLGSTSTIINGAGDELWTERYYPFGATRDIDATRPEQTDYRYTGQRFEDGLAGGLYDYRARYYDPVLGRFLQPDTIVPEPGNPQALNRYSYVNNNPLRYTDPSGHAAIGGDDYDDADYYESFVYFAEVLPAYESLERKLQGEEPWGFEIGDYENAIYVGIFVPDEGTSSLGISFTGGTLVYGQFSPAVTIDSQGDFYLNYSIEGGSMTLGTASITAFFATTNASDGEDILGSYIDVGGSGGEVVVGGHDHFTMDINGTRVPGGKIDGNKWNLGGGFNIGAGPVEGHLGGGKTYKLGGTYNIYELLHIKPLSFSNR